MIHRGHYLQRGRGLGGIFSSIRRVLKPNFSKTIVVRHVNAVVFCSVLPYFIVESKVQAHIYIYKTTDNKHR